MFVYDKWHEQTVVDIILSFSFPNILKKNIIVPRYKTFAIEFNA